MARALFHPSSTVREEFVHPKLGKGTRVWEYALSWRDLLLIDEVQVSLACQWQGIGTRLVNALLQAARCRNGWFYAVA